MLEGRELVVPSRAGRAALIELGRVPWHLLRSNHGYGEQEFVFSGPSSFYDSTPAPPRRVRQGMPSCLVDLFADDPQVRADAVLYGLQDTLEHQGSIYEVSGYVVPFLLAMIADPAIDDAPPPFLGIPMRRLLAQTLGTILIAALYWFDEPEAERVIAGFEAAETWRREAVATAPADLAEYLEFLGALVAEQPAWTAGLHNEMDARMAAICMPYVTE